jgi:hypothetical protein
MARKACYLGHWQRIAFRGIVNPGLAQPGAGLSPNRSHVVLVGKESGV